MINDNTAIDLHSGMPFWAIRNGLLANFPMLEAGLPDEDVVIIGSGISGAFAAHELCRAGHRCTMLDARLLSSGSTWASTAQLNYEIDAALYDLAKQYGEEDAAAIYRANYDSVVRVGEVLREAGVDADYTPRQSLYLASNAAGEKEIRRELEIRERHDLPAEAVSREQLISEYGIDRRLALRHGHAADLDSYRAAAGIIRHHAASGMLKVFTRTRIAKLEPGKQSVQLETDRGFAIRARAVVCAPGYESLEFLPKKVMKLKSTYALATQPLAESQLWHNRTLIWESARPYFYLRTTPDGRIMMGGGDVAFKNEALRDALMSRKKDKLLKNACGLMPRLPYLVADFTWCGTFGETDDGLPYIGQYPGMERVYFALGYGGNGTTFSMIAAQVIRNLLNGIPDDRARLFRFDR